MKEEKTDAQLMQEINILVNRLSIYGQMSMLSGYLAAMLANFKRQDPVMAEHILKLIQSDLENIEPMTKH